MCKCPWACSLVIQPIDMIRTGKPVVPPPINHFVMGCVKRWAHIRGVGCPPLQKMWTPPPAMRPHQLALCKVVSRHWIKKDYIRNEIPCHCILDAANILSLHQSTNVFRDESLHMVPIQQQALIYNWFWHFVTSSCLLLSFVATLWCHRCKLEMSLNLRCSHYDTIKCSGWKLRGNVQSCVAYLLCFGTRGIVLCKSRDVKKVQHAGGVSITGGKENRGVGEEKGTIYSSSCDYLVQLER